MMLAFQHDQKILIERAMVGKEVEVAVMGNDSPEASVHVGEIVPKLEFYDYNSKYYDDTADLYLPARISDEETSDRGEGIQGPGLPGSGPGGLLPAARWQLCAQ